MSDNSRTISLGLAKVEYGEVDAGGGMQTTLTQMGYTLLDSFELTTDEPDVTELNVEEIDSPIDLSGKFGKIVYEWDIANPNVSEMAATGGGTADTTNNEWAAPDAWSPIEKAFVFTPKKGFIHKIPRGSLIAYPKGGFKQSDPQVWHMKVTVLKNTSAAPRYLKLMTTPVVEKVATPTFSPASWEQSAGVTLSVTLACSTDGATIYYTTDGSTPTAESTAYSTAISVTATTTIKAIGIKQGMTNSDVASKTYTKPE